MGGRGRKQVRDKEFREWLEANGANTEAGRNTRSYAVRTVEAKLSELGFEQSTLDEILQADLFSDLRQAITELRRDFDQGGKRYKILMPNRSEEHTSELQSLMRISYAVFCLKNKNSDHRH